MCGIVGLVSAYKTGMSTPEKDAFGQMLFLDTFRGLDSTGVFSKNNQGEVDVMKKAVMAPIFMTTPDYQEFTNNLMKDGIFAVGHNRAATKGTVNDQNAHPFIVDDKIILVHNGTFFGNHKELKDTEVDSEAIAHVLAEEDDIEKALQKINSAYALTWYNTETRQLCLIRNTQRPLWIAKTRGGAFLFCSEPDTIEYAGRRAKWVWDTTPTDVEPYHLTTFTWDENHNKCTFEIKHLKDAYYKPKVINYGNNVQHHRGPVNHRHFSRDLDDEDGWNQMMAGEWGMNVHERMRVEESRRLMQQQQREKVVKPIEFKSVKDLLPLHAPQFLCENNKALEIMNAALELRKTKRLLVELQGYVKTADYPGNKPTWAVYGTLAETVTTGAEDMCIFWYVRNSDEAEVEEMVTSPAFYSVELTNHTMTQHKVDNKDMYSVTAFAMAPAVIKINAE